MNLRQYLFNSSCLFIYMLDKILSVISPNNTLMSDEAIELLNDPSTREEYINFATGIDSEGNKRKRPAKEIKTFIKKDGKRITVIKFK